MNKFWAQTGSPWNNGRFKNFQNLSKNQQIQALKDMREAILENQHAIFSLPVQLLSPFLWYPQSYFTDQIRGSFLVNFDDLMSHLNDVIAGKASSARSPWATSPPEVPVAGAPPFLDPQWDASLWGGECPWSYSRFGWKKGTDTEEEDFLSHLSILPTEDFRYSRYAVVRMRSIQNFPPMTGPWVGDPSIPLAPLETQDAKTSRTHRFANSSVPQPQMGKETKSEPQSEQRSNPHFRQETNETKPNSSFVRPSPSAQHETVNGRKHQAEPQFAHHSEPRQQTTEMRTNPRFKGPSAPQENFEIARSNKGHPKYAHYSELHIPQKTTEMRTNRRFKGPSAPQDNVDARSNKGHPKYAHYSEPHIPQQTTEMRTNRRFKGPSAPQENVDARRHKGHPKYAHHSEPQIRKQTNEMRTNRRFKGPSAPQENFDARNNEGHTQYAPHPAQYIYQQADGLVPNHCFVGPSAPKTYDSRKHKGHPQYVPHPAQYIDQQADMGPNHFWPSAPFDYQEAVDPWKHEEYPQYAPHPAQYIHQQADMGPNHFWPSVPFDYQETVDPWKHEEYPQYASHPAHYTHQQTFIPHETVDVRSQTGHPQYAHSAPYIHQQNNDLGPNHFFVGPSAQFTYQEAVDPWKHEEYPQYAPHPAQFIHQQADMGPNHYFVDPSAQFSYQEAVEYGKHNGHPQYAPHPAQYIDQQDMRTNRCFMGASAPFYPQDVGKKHEVEPQFAHHSDPYQTQKTNQTETSPWFSDAYDPFPKQETEQKPRQLPLQAPNISSTSPLHPDQYHAATHFVSSPFSSVAPVTPLMPPQLIPHLSSYLVQIVDPSNPEDHSHKFSEQSHFFPNH